MDFRTPQYAPRDTILGLLTGESTLFMVCGCVCDRRCRGNAKDVPDTGSNASACGGGSNCGAEKSDKVVGLTCALTCAANGTDRAQPG